jgi:hypothetical protein
MAAGPEAGAPAAGPVELEAAAGPVEAAEHGAEVADPATWGLEAKEESEAAEEEVCPGRLRPRRTSRQRAPQKAGR